MRTRSMIRNSVLATGLMLAFAAVPFGQVAAQDSGSMSSSSSTMQNPSSNQTVPDKAADGWITTKIKSELATAKGVKSTDISVSTSDGVVTLTGTAASNHEKMHVVHIARHVKGVKSVDSSGLTVSAAMKSSSMPASSSTSGG